MLLAGPGGLVAAAGQPRTQHGRCELEPGGHSRQCHPIGQQGMGAFDQAGSFAGWCRGLLGELGHTTIVLPARKAATGFTLPRGVTPTMEAVTRMVRPGATHPTQRTDATGWIPRRGAAVEPTEQHQRVCGATHLVVNGLDQCAQRSPYQYLRLLFRGLLRPGIAELDASGRPEGMVEDGGDLMALFRAEGPGQARVEPVRQRRRR